MKRLALTYVAASVLVCLAAEDAHAVFGVFTRITLETEEQYGIFVQILPVDGQKDKCRIMLSDLPSWLGAWFVVCKEHVPPEKQCFQSFIWANGADRTDVLSCVSLLPPGQYTYRMDEPFDATPLPPGQYGRSRVRVGDRPERADMILDRSLLAKSYIYLDYPHPMAEGAYIYCIDLSTYPLPEDRRISIRYSPAEGLGPEPGVMRCDPSDIIKVGDLYYLWYVKAAPGKERDGAIWYATSADGHTWVEKGEALRRGCQGSWDAETISAPNILFANGRYWLFYTGTSGLTSNPGRYWFLYFANVITLADETRPQATRSGIGIAAAQAPEGPWQKLSTNPVLRSTGDTRNRINVQVQDPSVIVRDGKYRVYFRSTDRHLGGTTVGVAVATAAKPDGPYNGDRMRPAIRGGYTSLVWPLRGGVAALITDGSDGVRNTLQYTPNGWEFSKMQDVDITLRSPGAYRPEAFTDSGKGGMIRWGIHTGHKEGSPPFLERFDCEQTSSAKP